jgi:hypothetical protein
MLFRYSALALMTVLTTTAALHPEATLKSAVTAVRAGQSLPVQGEKFTANQKVKLALQGALSTYELREVQAGGEGTFDIQLDVPREVRPGSYRLVALADDGDVVARIDLTVEAAPPATADEHAMHGVDAGDGEQPVARADELRIERSRSGVEWGAIGLLIGLAGGLGLSLLRRSV